MQALRPSDPTSQAGAPVRNGQQTSSVLLLSPFYFPELISTGKYNGTVVQALADRSVAVTVVCSHPLYPGWQPSIQPSSADPVGVRVLRGGGWLRYPAKPVLRRVILELWFAAHCMVQLLRGARRLRTIVAVFPPSLFMALVSAILPRSARVVGIVHDLQGIYVARGQGLVSRALESLIGAVERRAFGACDHLIFLSRTMRDLTVARYGVDPRLTSVHYPFTTIDTAVREAQCAAISSLFEPGRKAIVYSGALGEKQAPAQLVELIVDILSHYPDWQGRIFSQGPIFDRLRAEVSHPRLKFFPLVDVPLLPALLARSDVQIVPQAPGTSAGSLPSKLPNIIASGSRLLCITDSGSELAKLLAEYRGASVSTTWTRADCLAAFARLAELPLVCAADAAGLLHAFSLSALVDRILGGGAPTPAAASPTSGMS